ATYQSTCHFENDGAMEVSVSIQPYGDSMPELPRFGMRLLVDRSFSQVQWFGRGPFDNYCDRRAAAYVDAYSADAASLFHPYPRAQESGYRTGVLRMRMTGSKGEGIGFEGQPAFSFGVLPFNRTKIDFNRSKNIHGSTIDYDDYYWVNIDLQQMGVGGDNSWGARTHAEYLLPYRAYHYSFRIVKADAEQ
ncbi:MAG: hypothetical protein QM664_13020, partial [Flavihumibacter sp.]